MAYPNYQVNPFGYNNYYQDLQNMRDRIDNQMRQMQPMQMPQQPTAINQTFQLAPNQASNELESRYATNEDEVRNTLVMKTGLFINKDFTTLWIKDVTGNIRTFSLSEVIQLDEKDKQILALQKQIEDMKGMMNNAKSDYVDANESATIKKSSRVQHDKSNDE